MPYILEYESCRETIQSACDIAKDTEPGFWVDLISYWNQLMMTGQTDKLKSSVYNWRNQFQRHFSTETTVVRDIADMLYESFR